MTTMRRWPRRSAVLITCAGAMSVAGCTPGTSGSVASPASASSPSSPAASPSPTATATRTPTTAPLAALPDPRPRTDDLAVPDSLRLGTPVADVGGAGSAALPLGRMPAGATHLTFALVCAGGGELNLVDSAGAKRVIADCSTPVDDHLGKSFEFPGQSTRSRWRVDAGPATRWRVHVAAR